MNRNSSLKTGVKNASCLTAGNTLSQLIGLIAFFYIARILGPENYGIYTTVVAFVSFFHLFTFTGLSKSIIREGSKRVRCFHEILENTFAIKLCFILISIICCIIASFFTGYSIQTKFLIIVFSIEFIETGLRTYFGAIYQVAEKMQYIAYFDVGTKIIFTVLSIIFLNLGYGVLAIILINLVSRFCVLLINYITSKRFVMFRTNLKLIIDKQIIKPALIFSLIAFINALAVQVDILMISFLSTPEDVGIYSIAYKIVSEGNVLRNLVVTAFFPFAIKYFICGKIKKIQLFSYSIICLCVLLAICFIISFFIQDLVVVIFGERYSESGHILKTLLYYHIFTFYAIPFIISLQATYNEMLALVASIVMVFLNIPFNIAFFYRFGLIGIAYSTLVVYSVGNIVLSVLTYYKLWKQGYLV